MTPGNTPIPVESKRSAPVEPEPSDVKYSDLLPPWLGSLTLHLVLLICLGLIVYDVPSRIGDSFGELNCTVSSRDSDGLDEGKALDVASIEIPQAASLDATATTVAPAM